MAVHVDIIMHPKSYDVLVWPSWISSTRGSPGAVSFALSHGFPEAIRPVCCAEQAFGRPSTWGLTKRSFEQLHCTEPVFELCVGPHVIEHSKAFLGKPTGREAKSL